MKNSYITCILFFISFLSYSQTFDKKIEDLINENLDETIELRHWFHQNAELSNREFKYTRQFYHRYLVHLLY